MADTAKKEGDALLLRRHVVAGDVAPRRVGEHRSRAGAPMAHTPPCRQALRVGRLLQITILCPLGSARSGALGCGASRRCRK